jgi:hypothetical protein
MQLSRSTFFGVIIGLLAMAPLVSGQSSPVTAEITQGQGQGQGQQSRQQAGQQAELSPGAEEIARTIGVEPLIERFRHLPEHDRGLEGGVMSLEALSLRQEITESIVGASLEVDGLVSEIDSELERISTVRAQLEARRDHAQAINSLATIIAGGATGVAGTSMQFSDSTSQLGNAIGVAGGGVSTILSLIGLRQQRGGKLPLGVAPNMLAKIFDRQPEFHSDYPKEIWSYLNALPPTDAAHRTRREQLIKQWTDAGRIEVRTAPKTQSKIELLTSGVSNQRPLTIDLLDDRTAMLMDVRAMVSLMKRDLSKLLLALRS